MGKLIVVDDDLEVRSIVADFLADAGYMVLQAADGAQAPHNGGQQARPREQPGRAYHRSTQEADCYLPERAFDTRPCQRLVAMTGRASSFDKLLTTD
jgi:hypothetical protein